MTTITILTITFTLLLNSIPLINSHPSSTSHCKNDMSSKITHLHFYFHDIVSGSGRTAFNIVPPPKKSPFGFGFGSVVMIDDPLTEGPDMTSTLLGRAQGIYASADFEAPALLMIMNYVFTEASGYNGSTLSLMGRNAIASEVREMSIVGGTGVFRLASGYAQAKTFNFTLTGNAIVEYNVTVVQYS